MPLLGLLFNAVPTILAEIDKWKDRQANATTEKERIDAGVMIAQLQARADVLKEVAKWVWPIQLAYAVMFLVYDGKLVLWDKIVMQGHAHTDGLSPELMAIQMMVLGFLFLHRG